MIIKGILWIVLITSIFVLVLTVSQNNHTEGFDGGGGGITAINLQQLSTDALDRAPSTSEVKDDYKLLLVFADASMKAGGSSAVQALRVLADLRDRLFDKHDFRDNLKSDEFLAEFPKWLPPLDPTITEPAHTCVEAATAEAHVLAFLQKNFPQEASASEETGSTIRNIIEDFGYRFVFKRGVEQVVLAQGFLTKPLLRGWVSPCRG